MSTLALLIDRVNNPLPVLTRLSDALLQDIERGFAAETDPQGVPWTPLKAATLRRKRGPSILHEGGSLRRKMRVLKTEALKTLVRVSVGPDPKLPYARIHKMGGVAGGGARIPARNYAAPTPRFAASTLPAELSLHYIV